MSVEKTSFKRRIFITAFSLIAAIAITVFALKSPYALADEGFDYESDGWTYEEGGEKLYSSVLGTESVWYKELEGTDYNEILNIAESQHKYLSRLDSMFTCEEGTLMYELLEGSGSPVKTGREIMTAIGAAIVMLYGFIELIRALRSENKDAVSVILRITILTVTGLLLVIYVYDILSFIEKIGGLLVDGFKDITGGYETAYITYERKEVIEEAEETIKSADGINTFWSSITAWVKNAWETSTDWISAITANLGKSIRAGFIKGIANIGLSLTFYSILTGAYGLLFEMVIRKIFMPLAMADLMAEGIRSPAVRYLKNYFGMYIRIIMFLIILYILHYTEYWAAAYDSAEAAWSVNTFLGPLGVVMCSRAAAKALMSATGALSKEILGS